jgi:hypothetical protein|tara:strand:- start:1796 stop:2344 length:549 start_codon:yes stop_codon:yes gene_type:complete
MAFNIQEIRSQLTLGGARASLFQVQIANPANGAGDIKVPFMVKAAQIPASTTGVIEVPYFGRKIKVAGDRTFAEWTVTIINDEDFLIRNAMEQWSNSINSHAGNIREFGSASPLLYKSNAQITQFSKTGVPIREYTFNGMFPTEVSAIDMAWETTDAIEEFTVTFQYDFWEVSGGVTGNSTA